jgi:predicted MFS family arabinose efflux permease
LLIALLAPTLSAFAIGTTEFVIVGLVTTIAGNPRRQPAIGRAAGSLYALDVVWSAPRYSRPER